MRGSCTDPLLAGVHGLGRLIAVLLCVSALATAVGQESTETFDLVGAVATVTEFVEYPGATQRNVFQTLAFRPDGTALEHVYLGYSYMDGSLEERRVTTYDEAGKPLARVTTDPDGTPLGRTEFRYDGDGRLVEEASFDTAGAETRRVTYERNADGDVVVWEVYTNGELDRRTEVDYDGRGHVVEERTYEDGRPTELATYSEPGRVFEVVAYDGAGRVRSTRTGVESAHGMERMEIFDRDGHVQFVSTWSYDANGHMTERSTVDGSGVGEVYTYAYELDGTGNWIRMVVTEAVGGMEPTTYEIRDREITYH